MRLARVRAPMLALLSRRLGRFIRRLRLSGTASAEDAAVELGEHLAQPLGHNGIRRIAVSSNAPHVLSTT